MPDEQTQTPGVSNDDAGSATDEVKVGRAELEQMKLDAQAYGELKEISKQAEMDDPREYVAELEMIANDKLNAQPAPQPDPAPTPKPVEPAPAAPAPAMSPEETKRLDALDKRSTQNLLMSHQTQWGVTQSQLQPSDKSVATERELSKIIYDSPTAIRELAPKYGGNVYAAANALFESSPEGHKKIGEAAAAREAAKSNAAAGATLPGGGTTAAPEGQTAEDKAKAQQKAYADDIAPDDALYGKDNW